MEMLRYALDDPLEPVVTQAVLEAQGRGKAGNISYTKTLPDENAPCWRAWYSHIDPSPADHFHQGAPADEPISSRVRFVEIHEDSE